MNAPFALQTETISVADLCDPGEVARIDGFLREMAGLGSTPFHRPAWLRAVQCGTGQRATGLVAEKGGTITGWLPLTVVRSPLFGFGLVSSGFGVGGGILAHRTGTAERLARAAEELAGHFRCSSVELRSPKAPQDWARIEGRHCNFSADLAEDDEAQLLAVPRKQRAEIRKALKNDLTVTVGSLEKDRLAHYEVYAVSVHNLGTPVFPRKLFDAVLGKFGKRADILTVWHKRKAVASVLTLYHDGAAMPFWGGGTFEARGLRANELMYYRLMCHARELGCTRFDFGRSKTGSGPYKYKKNWGFEPEPLVYREWTAPGSKPRNIDPTDAGYSAKIALWKKLPLPVANLIGPWIARGLA